MKSFFARFANRAAAVVYSGLTLVGAWIYLEDCRTEPSLFDPGDSVIGLLFLHHTGALLWLAIWLASGLGDWRYVKRLALPETIASLAGITVAGVAGSLVVDTVPFIPEIAWHWPYLASFTVFGALPGLRGALWGARMAEGLAAARSAGPMPGVGLLAATSVVGATAAWWPMGLATMIGVAVNVRRTVALDGNDWAALVVSAVFAILTALVSALDLLVIRRKGTSKTT